MIRFLFFAVVCAGVLSSIADGGYCAVNSIGVYADTEATSACTDSSGNIVCYVIVKNLNDPIGISGWQFQLSIDSGALFSPLYEADVLNLENFPRLFIGCAAPIAADSVVVLMSFGAYATGPASIFISKLDVSTPTAIVGAAEGELIQLDYEYGGESAPVFAMGGATCPIKNADVGGVAIELATWGSLKALFR